MHIFSLSLYLYYVSSLCLCFMPALLFLAVRLLGGMKSRKRFSIVLFNSLCPYHFINIWDWRQFMIKREGVKWEGMKWETVKWMLLNLIFYTFIRFVFAHHLWDIIKMFKVTFRQKTGLRFFKMQHTGDKNVKVGNRERERKICQLNETFPIEKALRLYLNEMLWSGLPVKWGATNSLCNKWKEVAENGHTVSLL